MMQSSTATRWGVAAVSGLVSVAALAHGSVGFRDAVGRAIEFPDTESHLTLVVDLHTHSVFSDGHVWPSVRVAEALLDGLDALAITEHLEWQPHLVDIPHPDRNRSYQVALASVRSDRELIVIAGSEITRLAPAGHMNAVFISDANTLFEAGPPPEPFDARVYSRQAGEWPAQNAVDAANAQGAFVFWNHSWSNFDSLKTEITDFHRDNAATGKLHGIEIANGRTYSPESFQVALDHDLALIGVSDIHNLIDWDYLPHEGGHRPVNLVFATEKTGEAIREALFARRTAVWYKNLLLARPAEMTQLLEASLVATRASYRPNSLILEVVLENRSDATLKLRNTSGYSLVRNFELVEVPAHKEVTLLVRTGSRLQQADLRFEVLNALTAPNTTATLAFSLTPTDMAP
ncbi:MAG: Sb-PDE family phosphodiesterase [Acidobacteriota bacterium]|nr:Sb-PDE family phosphodiesterase [Acidobacteriota bacterium]